MSTQVLRKLARYVIGSVTALGHSYKVIIQTEAERRRREAVVKQSMEIRVRSCMYVCGYVGMYGIWNYLANQGT